MNHREPPQLSAGLRRTLHCLSLFLLPAFAPDGVQALPRTRPARIGSDLGTMEGIPYLPVVGPPPLRFQEAAPPPDLVTRPAAAAPPLPALSPAETSVALANAAASSASAALLAEAELAEEEAKSKTKAAAAKPAAPPVKAPPPILPDSGRPTVRPEDFLPYFQVPISGRAPANVTIVAPVPPAAPTPGTLPASSATYKQTP